MTWGYIPEVGERYETSMKKMYNMEKMMMSVGAEACYEQDPLKKQACLGFLSQMLRNKDNQTKITGANLRLLYIYRNEFHTLTTGELLD